MIPSSWWRKLILAVFILGMGGGFMWLATVAAPGPSSEVFAQAIAGIAFLLSFYAGTPVFARFLAPEASKNEAMQQRLRQFAETMPGSCPIFLYENKDKNANTVGIVPAHSKVYITTGLMERISDEGLRGVLAHENTHVREHHILVTATYACTYALVAHLTNNSHLFVSGFLAFMTLRRHLEYRADAGGAKLVGKEVMTKGLKELNSIYPSKWWERWLVFLTSYPTLPMRLKALETGKKTLF